MKAKFIVMLLCLTMALGGCTEFTEKSSVDLSETEVNLSEKSEEYSVADDMSVEDSIGNNVSVDDDIESQENESAEWLQALSYLEEADNCFAKEELEQAYDFCKLAIDVVPSYADIYIQVSNVCLKYNYIEKALEFLKSGMDYCDDQDVLAEQYEYVKDHVFVMHYRSDNIDLAAGLDFDAYYTYDDNWILQEKMIYTYGDKQYPYEKYQYEYDERGRTCIEHYWLYLPDGTGEGMDEYYSPAYYDYDEQDRVIHIKTIGISDSITEQFREYDSKNRLSKITVDYEAKYVNSYVKMYSYNEENDDGYDVDIRYESGDSEHIHIPYKASLAGTYYLEEWDTDGEFKLDYMDNLIYYFLDYGYDEYEEHVYKYDYYFPVEFIK